MASDFRDTWDAGAGRVRLLIAQALKESDQGREELAEALVALEELGADVRCFLSEGQRPAGASDVVAKPKRKQPKRYTVETRRRRPVLCEYRSDAEQPFCCPQDVYDATAEVLAGLKKPAHFDDLLPKVNKKLKREAAVYLLRVCLRCWLDAGLVRRSSSLYSAAEGAAIKKSSQALWKQMESAS